MTNFDPIISITLLLIFFAAAIICDYAFSLKENKDSHLKRSLEIKNKAFLAPLILLLIPFLLLITTRLINDNTIKNIYNASFNYNLCLTKRISEDDCARKYAFLNARISEGEVNKKENNIISAASLMGMYDADSSHDPEQSPYQLITDSLSKYPLFIAADKANYLIFKKNCDKITDQIYRVVAWSFSNKNKYILVTKSNSCPDLSDFITNSKFPYITDTQFNQTMELTGEANIHKTQLSFMLLKLKFQFPQMKT
jgi:hypothetical protein